MKTSRRTLRRKIKSARRQKRQLIRQVKWMKTAKETEILELARSLLKWEWKIGRLQIAWRRK